MATVWTETLKQELVDKYLEMDPTPASNAEIVKELAEELGEGYTANGVRQVLVQAKVYVGKAPESTPDKKTTTGKTAAGGTRVSKDSQLDLLRDLIRKRSGSEPDEEILGKLTGKAAAYLAAALA